MCAYNTHTACFLSLSLSLSPSLPHTRTHTHKHLTQTHTHTYTQCQQWEWVSQDAGDVRFVNVLLYIQHPHTTTYLASSYHYISSVRILLYIYLSRTTIYLASSYYYNRDAAVIYVSRALRAKLAPQSQSSLRPMRQRSLSMASTWRSQHTYVTGI